MYATVEHVKIICLCYCLLLYPLPFINGTPFICGVCNLYIMIVYILRNQQIFLLLKLNLYSRSFVVKFIYKPHSYNLNCNAHVFVYIRMYRKYFFINAICSWHIPKEIYMKFAPLFKKHRYKN